MALSVFGKKEEMPCDKNLGEVLEDKKLVWDNIIKSMEDTYQDMSYEWKFYSKQAGWSFVIKSRKRTAMYLIPQEGYFKAGFVYGEKVLKEAEKADIPENLINIIKEAQCYAEGRSFMIDVKREEEQGLIETLVKIKLNN
ncbi:DUF3788 family protein [Lacrimispora brassicae]